ncbi:unnamed protein product [Nesidiocoris tenuis]|uniref:C2H2-type domain-containing protein n=1 Tax=Nesidiocoris tenuis TaxID=355587 RepID=A0A6H5GQW4_9HEMI|nr:unnamed protein product [Nesidiocoris tenuis]
MSFNERLIEFVKNHDCLWDPKSKHYRNRDHVMRKWEEIAHVLDSDGDSSDEASTRESTPTAKSKPITKSTPIAKSIAKNVPCPHCAKMFTTPRNVNRHIRRAHPAEPIPRYECDHCGFTSQYKHCLKTHILTRHEDPRTQNLLGPFRAQKNDLYCARCDRAFPNRKGLNRHIKRLHTPAAARFECYHCGFKTKYKHSLKWHVVERHQKIKEKSIISRPSISCVFCRDFTSHRRSEMMRHYEEAHEVPLRQETLTFESFEDFEKWKESVERADASRFNFIRRKDYRYFRCFRDGYFHSRSVGKRRLKAKGSVKIGGFCPASMKIVEKNGSLKVTYIPNHVGHGKDLIHLNLTMKEKVEIAGKLAQNIPCRAILEEIKASKPEEIQRLHLTTRKDILNIRTSFNLDKPNASFTDDPTSAYEFRTPDSPESEDGENIDSADLIMRIDDKESIREIVVGEIGNFDEEAYLNERVAQLRRKFEEILNRVRSEEHVDIIWNALLPVVPAIDSTSSNKVDFLLDVEVPDEVNRD